VGGLLDNKLVIQLDSDPFAPGWGVCGDMTCHCGTGEDDDNDKKQGSIEEYIVSFKSNWNEWQLTCRLYVVTAEDVAWLRWHNLIVNPPADSSFANRQCTCSCPVADWSLWGWDALAGWLFNDLRCGQVMFWHFGGWMGDNLEFFGETLSLLLVMNLFYYYISHIHGWRLGLTVHDIRMNRWDTDVWETHISSDRTPSIAIM